MQASMPFSFDILVPFVHCTAPRVGITGKLPPRYRNTNLYGI